MDQIGINDVRVEVFIGKVGGLNGDGGGGVLRFRKGCCMILSKILDIGSEEEGGEDTFGIGSTCSGSEV